VAETIWDVTVVPDDDDAAVENDGRPQKSFLVKIYPAGNIGGMLELSKPLLVIGRDSTCDLAVPDEAASRQHAAIEGKDGGFEITDLRSTNGTFVNDQRIVKQPLNTGDLIRVGTHIFKFLSDDQVEAQYHETVYSMTTSDALTSVYNKRFLLDALEHERVRSQRHKRPLALMMLDVDHFKSINDTHGHLAGDEILRSLCARARSVLRQDEILARYGGEEFAVVMGEATMGIAETAAERLRESIAAEPFETDQGLIAVTVSIGIAQTDGQENLSTAELIELADRRLYEAKRAGRNCVVS
jgi:diguanylate cyclase (GGDEF)-like protein